MADNKALIGVAFVALFVLGVLVGVFWLSEGEEQVAQVSLEEPEPHFKPWDETLALTSPFPRFIFLPLNNPAVVPADMAPFMKDDDIVAGVVVEGQARAYPQWVLVAYHVVNDTIGESPLLLAHCEICSGTSAFDPMVEAFEGQNPEFSDSRYCQRHFQRLRLSDPDRVVSLHGPGHGGAPLSLPDGPNPSDRGALGRVAKTLSRHRSPAGHPENGSRYGIMDAETPTRSDMTFFPTDSRTSPIWTTLAWGETNWSSAWPTWQGHRNHRLSAGVSEKAGRALQIPICGRGLSAQANRRLCGRGLSIEKRRGREGVSSDQRDPLPGGRRPGGRLGRIRACRQ